MPLLYKFEFDIPIVPNFAAMSRTARQTTDAPKKCKAMSTRNSPQTPCKHNAKINGYCTTHYNVHCRPSDGVRKPSAKINARPVRGWPVGQVDRRKIHTAIVYNEPELTVSHDSDDSDSIEPPDDSSSDEVIEYVDETSDGHLDTLADKIAAARKQLDKIEDIVSDIRKIMKFSKELARPPAILTASIEQSRGGLSDDIRELQRTVSLMQ